MLHSKCLAFYQANSYYVNGVLHTGTDHRCIFFNYSTFLLTLRISCSISLLMTSLLINQGLTTGKQSLVSQTFIVYIAKMLSKLTNDFYNLLQTADTPAVLAQLL